MKFPRTMVRQRHLRYGVASVAAVGLLLASPAGAQAASAPVPLGTAGGFVVLAGAGVTNTGPTTLNGDIGTFPTLTITGTGSMTVTGADHHGDAVTQQAKTDLVTAYKAAAGQGPTSPISGDLTGKTLTPGVYNSAISIGLTGALTLDAKGNPNAVFVFQAGSSLTTGSGSKVNLINGASACNVFWQVASSATIGTGSTFRGTIMALDDITLTTGATVDGRALARVGAVTLDHNTISRAVCATTPAVKVAAQVAAVPRGAVRTGDGSTSGGSDGRALVAGALVLAGAGASVVAARRRRRLNL